MKLQIEMLPLNMLRVYDNNTRKHTEKDIDMLAANIKTFGFNDPIGIWSNKNVIVEGHGRYYAAKNLGIENVPVIRLDHLTDDERKAYAIAHNKTAELSSWDFDEYMAELERLPTIDTELLGLEIKLTENISENSISEISIEEFEDERFKCKCPECGFRFNP